MKTSKKNMFVRFAGLYTIYGVLFGTLAYIGIWVIGNSLNFVWQSYFQWKIQPWLVEPLVFDSYFRGWLLTFTVISFIGGLWHYLCYEDKEYLRSLTPEDYKKEIERRELDHEYDVQG